MVAGRVTDSAIPLRKVIDGETIVHFAYKIRFAVVVTTPFMAILVPVPAALVSVVLFLLNKVLEIVYVIVELFVFAEYIAPAIADIFSENSQLLIVKLPVPPVVEKPALIAPPASLEVFLMILQLVMVKFLVLALL